jgi:hypothetical protein
MWQCSRIRTSLTLTTRVSEISKIESRLEHATDAPSKDTSLADQQQNRRSGETAVE